MAHIKLNCITVCSEMSDILALTLPRNRHHFFSVTVITEPHDWRTQVLARDCQSNLFLTHSLRDSPDAPFRKWKALEEGLDAIGRDGWICVMDCDVVWPRRIDYDFEIGCLYTPRRRVVEDLSEVAKNGIPPRYRWKRYPLHRNEEEWAGYTQIFWANDPALGQPPWYDTTWIHCGGADSEFQNKWPREKKIRPGWEVLHLGPCGQNWCGRTTDMLDGTPIPQAEERSKKLQKIITQRQSNPPGDRFRHEKL